MVDKSNVKVFILAAGFGKRLKNLTRFKPKPLIDIDGTPVLSRVIQKFLVNGFKQENIIINTHYLAEQINEFINENFSGIKISHEPEIRGTGGALFAAESFLRGYDTLVHNADIISDENLDQFLEFSQNNPAIATLMIRKDRSAIKYGNIVIDNEGYVLDIANQLGLEMESPYMFTGIHFYKKEIWTFSKECHFCSIWQSHYIPALTAGEKISTFISDSYWNDIGDEQRLQEVRDYFHREKI